jgi:hypothetical protein
MSEKERTDGELLADLFEMLAVGVAAGRDALAAGMESPGPTSEWLGWIGTQMAVTARSRALLDRARLSPEARVMVEQWVAAGNGRKS